MVHEHRLRVAGAELIAGLGLVFVLAGVSFWYTTILPTRPPMQAALYELVMHVLFGVVILALGIHTERSDLTVDERFDVMLWCFSGFLFLVTLAVWGELTTLSSEGLTSTVVSAVVVFGSMGGAFGGIAGVNWGRSHRNQELAKENEAQRETLVLLTRLLRHDIRNDMMAIKGHADIVSEHVAQDGKSSVAVIQQYADAILRLLSDTVDVAKSLGGERELTRIDLTRVLREEALSFQDANPTVDVKTEIPDGLRVIADSLIHQLFRNLLENSVAHNDPEGLSIRLEVLETDGTVEVVIADNGRGIPAELGEGCFELGEQGERSSGDGLGLYLVSRLADIYGGSVALQESTDGATFRVTLKTAD